MAPGSVQTIVRLHVSVSFYLGRFWDHSFGDTLFHTHPEALATVTQPLQPGQ